MNPALPQAKLGKSASEHENQETWQHYEKSELAETQYSMLEALPMSAAHLLEVHAAAAAHRLESDEVYLETKHEEAEIPSRP